MVLMPFTLKELCILPESLSENAASQNYKTIYLNDDINMI
jgi:hypothetical protein